MLDSPALALSDKRIYRLLPQGFKNMLIIFKRKKQNYKTPHNDYLRPRGFIKRPQRDKDYTSGIKKGFKIMKEYEIDCVKHILLSVGRHVYRVKS